MTLLVVGAPEPALREIRALVPAGVRVVSRGAADWIIVATPRQRVEAFNAHRLPPYRVVEVPDVATELNDRKTRDGVRAILVAMAGIGPVRETTSGAGVALARLFVRRMTGGEPVQVPPPVGVALPVDAVPIGTDVTGVAGRIAAGPHLDEILATLALERARRFVSRAVRFE